MLPTCHIAPAMAPFCCVTTGGDHRPCVSATTRTPPVLFVGAVVLMLASQIHFGLSIGNREWHLVRDGRGDQRVLQRVGNILPDARHARAAASVIAPTVDWAT